MWIFKKEPESRPEYTQFIAESELSLTPSARQKFSQLLSSEPEVSAVRLYVGGGGCSGMTYGMTFADTPLETDKIFQQGDITLYLDIMAYHYLNGTEIDYLVEETGERFVFNNAFAVNKGSGACSACASAK